MNSIRSRLLWSAALVFWYAGCALTQTPAPIPRTRFSCQGRGSGYYADVDTGCQVYHMCDGLGRQFSYSCPNTTLFQQRMLICDHWYMVNCSKAESDYDANLLIGQRDKPFVSEHEMHQRTPRPDILNVPYNSNYYDGLKQAETKYPSHPDNSIGGSDSFNLGANNGLDSGKTNLPTHWSTHINQQHHGTFNDLEDRPPSSTHSSVSNNQRPTNPTPNVDQNLNFGERDHRTQPSTVNLQYTSSTAKSINTNVGLEDSDEYQIDIRMKSEERTKDPVYNFIKRFDPNSPASNTAMTTSEILHINSQLPASSDTSAENAKKSTRRKSISAANSFNSFQTNEDKIRPTPSTVIRTANTKPSNYNNNLDRRPPFNNGQPIQTTPDIPVPDRVLQPPKEDYSILPSTTMGPPIYYEWKWAVPAFDLEPPKADNETLHSTVSTLQTSESGTPTFRNFTTRSSATPRSLDASSPTERPEYNPTSYFVPDYIFPLDKHHPGYQENGARTSFQVNVPGQGRSYGENLKCPQCHPAYLNPGTCEPCVVKR